MEEMIQFYTSMVVSKWVAEIKHQLESNIWWLLGKETTAIIDVDLFEVIFFSVYHIVNHHYFVPPFGRICFGTFCQNILGKPGGFSQRRCDPFDLHPGI